MNVVLIGQEKSDEKARIASPGVTTEKASSDSKQHASSFSSAAKLDASVQDLYEWEGHLADSEEELALWTRFDTAAVVTQGMLAPIDVEQAIKASKFKKGLSLDGFEALFSDLETPPTA